MTRFNAIFVTLLLALPAAASAHGPATLAPPGNSGISQYLETVPTDSGSKPSSSHGAPGAGLTPRQQQKLDSLGASGKTLAAVVSATAPAPVTASAHRDAKRPAGGSSGAATPASGSTGAQQPGGGRSPVSSVVSAALGGGGGGGLGWFLPTLIVLTTLAVLAQVVWRLRRGRTT